MPKFQRLYHSSFSSLVTSENHVFYKVFLKGFGNIKPFPERFFIENISFMKWDGYLKVLAYLQKSYGLEWKIERIVKDHIIMLIIYIYILGLWENFLKEGSNLFSERIFAWKLKLPEDSYHYNYLNLNLRLRISILSTAIGGLNQEKKFFNTVLRKKRSKFNNIIFP